MTEDANLKKYVDDFFKNLTLYDDYHNKHNYKDLLKASIDVFLDYENDYNAYEVYETFFMIYQITPEDKSDELITDSKLISEPNTLVKLAEIMKNYEENTGELIEKQRDHFIHSVNVFLLGLAIYSQNNEYRQRFSDYILSNADKYEKYYKLEDGTLSDEEFLYRWGIAALFHDIGYPVEIIAKELTKFIDDGIESISDKYNVDTSIKFKDFKEFNQIVKEDPNFTVAFREDYPETHFLDLYKPTDIMAHKIAVDLGLGEDINILCRKLDTFVDYMGENNFIDHGYFSAILVLNSYAALMQKHFNGKNNQKYDYFFYPIVDSATAILLHNYYRNAMQKEFKQARLNPSRSPISYLLILCDELQEWNRKPLGVKNRRHAYVNEMKIYLKEDSLNIEYEVNNGSIGLGFKEDKEKLLKKLLDIDTIFKKGFNVYIDTKLDLNKQAEIILPSETETPHVLLRNIEKIAEQIHEKYRQKKISQGEDDPGKYSDLKAEYKKSNVRQAKSYPYKLNVIGCEIVPKSSKREVHKFSNEEVEVLAKLEHESWCNEKINNGWISHHDATNPEIMGEDIISQEEYERFCQSNMEEENPLIDKIDKDDERKIHPNLVDWSELTEKTKEKDREPIRQMHEILDNLNFKIVETKIRLLTFEMHNVFKEYAGLDIPEFNDLSLETKYSNFKQTAFLVQILSEEGYKIVSTDEKGKAIKSFEDNQLEQFARLEHEKWYEEKVKLGWTVCSHIDEDSSDSSKCSKNLVPWNRLNIKSRDANKNTFLKLPESCDNVGLKIIKIK